MSSRYCIEFTHSKARDQQRFCDLSETQLVQTILAQGLHRVLTIKHDVPDVENARPLETKEVISIWKGVFKVIQNRKANSRRFPSGKFSSAVPIVYGDDAKLT